MQSLKSLSTQSLHRRRAVVTLELILVLPLFLIALMAIAQFGLLLSNEQYLSEASRAGAQVASDITGISEVDGASVPSTVLDAVSVPLSRIGIANYSVRLEHNIDTSIPITNPTVVLKSSVGTGPTNSPAPAAVALSPNRTYVRVTVCVRTTELTPNLLNTFGVNFSTRVSDETTLRRYTR
jgi:Flp pilus assembly protein TadG